MTRVHHGFLSYSPLSPFLPSPFSSPSSLISAKPVVFFAATFSLAFVCLLVFTYISIFILRPFPILLSFDVYITPHPTPFYPLPRLFIPFLVVTVFIGTLLSSHSYDIGDTIWSTIFVSLWIKQMVTMVCECCTK